MHQQNVSYTTIVTLLLTFGGTANVVAGSVDSDSCGVWIGIIGLGSAERGYHDLIEETRVIPLVLPPDDHAEQWGFAIACDDDQPCSVSYALYAPTENWGKKTKDTPEFERVITTPPGGMVRPFGFDPGDYYGTYRLVVGLEGRVVCDTTVKVVE